MSAKVYLLMKEWTDHRGMVSSSIIQKGYLDEKLANWHCNALNQSTEDHGLLYYVTYVDLEIQMVDNIPQQENRYHIARHEDGHWICRDLLMHVTGVGATPSDALTDAQIELEMQTSDIHK